MIVVKIFRFVDVATLLAYNVTKKLMDFFKVLRGDRNHLHEWQVE